MPIRQAGSKILDVLEAWQREGWIRALDLAFARFIANAVNEQGEQPQDLLILLAALVSHQVGRGHVCLALDQLIDRPNKTLALPPEGGGGTDLATPQDVLGTASMEDCMHALGRSSAVSRGDVPAPLVLADGRLYLRRYWRYEQQIAAGIRQRLKAATPLDDAGSPEAATLSQALDVLFQSRQAVDYQKVACALAARKRFGVITGGPGTGKTTTVVRLLAALQSVAGEQNERTRKLRIRLAAPTGKAAARLNESIAGAVENLPLNKLPGGVARNDIPTKVTTLHRLLGSRPNTRRLRHNRDNPLILDILVIDEASMVDVELMAAVFQALPDNAQLILLGDKDQLASVDAGAVLGELCKRADQAHYLPGTADWLQRITGYAVPKELIDAQGKPLDQAVAMLRKSYRFGEDSGIRTIATAVNAGHLDQSLLQQLKSRGFPDVAWINGKSSQSQPPEQIQSLLQTHALTGSADAFIKPRSKQPDSPQADLFAQPEPPTRSSAGNDSANAPQGYRHYLQLIKRHSLTAESPKEHWDDWARSALSAFARFQILCALREGPWGVEGINQLVAQKLFSEKLISRTEGWYAGRPVLITSNDYNLGLMNGDIGITVEVPWDQTEEGEPRNTLRVVFPAGDGTNAIRWISPSRLGQLETVYAMTVHKSQGSEFGHCCLVLPDKLSPVLTKELIYTGITRARNWFSLITGNEWVLKEAVAQRVERASGLFE